MFYLIYCFLLSSIVIPTSFTSNLCRFYLLLGHSFPLFPSSPLSFCAGFFRCYSSLTFSPPVFPWPLPAASFFAITLFSQSLIHQACRVLSKVAIKQLQLPKEFSWQECPWQEESPSRCSWHNHLYATFSSWQEILAQGRTRKGFLCPSYFQPQQPLGPPTTSWSLCQDHFV